MSSSKKKTINKFGYSILVGILCLAYVSEMEPSSGGWFFLIGFVSTFVIIVLLEIIYEFMCQDELSHKKASIRKRKLVRKNDLTHKDDLKHKNEI